MRKTERKPFFLPFVLLGVGILLIVYPIVVQTQELQQDAMVYEALALQQVIEPEAKLPAATALASVEESSSLSPLLSAKPTVTDVQNTPIETPMETEDTEAFTALLPGKVDEAAQSLISLQAENEDFIAWLSIPDTIISYPVVRSDDSDYYLHHLFTGQKSKLGCLFSLTTSDYEKPSRNIAIYGHHLSNSDAMFSTLIAYKDEAYYLEHPVIRLDSLYGTRRYQIFAVLNQQVTDWDASTAVFANDKAFLQFVNRAKQLALYETNVEVMPNDHVLTLITCDRSYGGLRGRLVVMAVEI